MTEVWLDSISAQIMQSYNDSDLKCQIHRWVNLENDFILLSVNCFNQDVTSFDSNHGWEDIINNNKLLHVRRTKYKMTF